MNDKLKHAVESIFRITGFEIVRAYDTVTYFHQNQYLQHNSRRLEHLASLRVPVVGMSVLEVGAGVGDHSHYYLDRGCRITITDARPDNIEYLKIRYPQHDIQFLDLAHPTPIKNSPFGLVYCYGLLYHLPNPAEALEYLSGCCTSMLFLETCVSFGVKKEINIVTEDIKNPTQAFAGKGCRPTRIWLFDKLKELFEYVYVPVTQPNHEEFPIDWTAPEKHHHNLSRAIFIASRRKIDNSILVPSLIDLQVRHE